VILQSDSDHYGIACIASEFSVRMQELLKDRPGSLVRWFTSSENVFAARVDKGIDYSSIRTYGFSHIKPEAEM
jgi:hypothetical protein